MKRVALVSALLCFTAINKDIAQGRYSGGGQTANASTYNYAAGNSYSNAGNYTSNSSSAYSTSRADAGSRLSYPAQGSQTSYVSTNNGYNRSSAAYNPAASSGPTLNYYGSNSTYAPSGYYLKPPMGASVGGARYNYVTKKYKSPYLPSPSLITKAQSTIPIMYA